MNAKRARIIKNVLQAAVVVGLGYLVRHQVAATHAPGWIAASWLLTAWVVLRLGMALKRGLATARQHTAGGVTVDSVDQVVAASLQPWSRGAYQMEKLVYRGAWRSLTRAPLARAGEFSVDGARAGGALAAGVLVLVIAAALACALWVAPLLAGFWPRALTFAAAVLTIPYALVWFFGERRTLREGGHRVTRAQVLFNVGVRCSGAVALGAIVACGAFDARARQIDRGELWTVSPGAAANVLIELAAPTTLSVTAFGWPRDVDKRYIAVYVDQPAAFVDAIMLARARALADDSAAPLSSG